MERANKGKLKTIDFFCIGFGAIVGVGWAVSINGWMINSGGPIPAAAGFMLTLVMTVPIALMYCELVPMFPVAGGGMTFAWEAFGRFAALISGWAAFGAFVSILPWEAIQITTMLGYLFPGLVAGEPLYTVAGSGIYLITIVIGSGVSVLMYLINMRGLAAAAKVQRFLCIFLVATALIGGAAAVLGGSPSNLLPVYENVGGSSTHSSFMGGVLAMLAVSSFYIAGFETIPQGVEEAGGSMTSVGKTVVSSEILACVFYALMLFCFGSALPWKELCALPKPVAAEAFRVLYGGALGELLYWMIVLGAIAGLLTTWNSFFSASANLLMAMSRNGLMPKAFAKQNDKNVAVNSMALCFILSLVGPFLGIGLIDTVTSFSSTAYVLSWAITSYCVIRLRKTRPGAPRPFKLPGGMGTARFAALASTAVLLLLFIPGNPTFIGLTAASAFAVWMAAGLVLGLIAAGRPDDARLKDKR
ncbi:MAG: APC family permease [Firmicutes bacterium]|nr:APC family permease [Bacillota bacterium]